MEDRYLQELKRAHDAGDIEASVRYGQSLSRLGRNKEALPILMHAYDVDPARKPLREDIIDAGGFCPVLVKDKRLGGKAFRYHNLPLGERKYNIIQSAGFITEERLLKGQRRNDIADSEDGWLSYVGGKGEVSIMNAQIEGAVKANMFAIREHAGFQREVARYTAAHRGLEREMQFYGVLDRHGSIPGLRQASINGGEMLVPLRFPRGGEIERWWAPEHYDRQTETLQCLEDIFGQRASTIIPALQYFSARSHEHMRSVTFFIPEETTIREAENDLHEDEQLLISLNTSASLSSFDIDCLLNDEGKVVGWRHFTPKRTK